MKVIRAERQHCAAICDIYSHYIENSIATFEERVIGEDEIWARMQTQPKFPWLVASIDGKILGYAYACQWKSRAAYRYSAEVTVYLKPGSEGRGIGTALYEALFATHELQACHALLSCISLPNDASVQLHEKFGFSKVGHFSEVGKKFGQWIDVGYWQRMQTAVSIPPL